MELRKYFWTALRRAWILVLIPSLTVAGAYTYSKSVAPTYSSKTTLLVTQRSSENAAIQYNDILASQQLTSTYAKLVTTRPVLEEVVADLGLSYGPFDLRKKITVVTDEATQLLEVQVRDKNSPQAGRIADSLARNFIRLNETKFGGAADVAVAEPAVPGGRVAPNTRSNVTLAFVFGIVLALIAIVILEYVSDAVKDPQELQDLTGLGLIGLIPDLKSASKRRKSGRKDERTPIVGLEGQGERAMEAYRLLRTNLEFATADAPARSVLVTSTQPGEGKTTTALNLANVLSQLEQRVLLVDSDLRRPSIHKVLGVPNDRGLTTVISGDLDVTKAALQVKENLFVVPAGPIPPNPAELLRGHRAQHKLLELREAFDIVIMDSPPILAVADSSILAAYADAAIFVVDASKTRMGAIERATQALQTTGVRGLGIVLNRVSARRIGGYGYGYGYAYKGYYSSDTAPDDGRPDELAATPALGRTDK